MEANKTQRFVYPERVQEWVPIGSSQPVAFAVDLTVLCASSDTGDRTDTLEGTQTLVIRGKVDSTLLADPNSLHNRAQVMGHVTSGGHTN